jgi:hypothetical protein
MEPTICGASAFAWWRTPPLIRTLATRGWTDVPELGSSAEKALEAHVACVRELPFWRAVASVAGRPCEDASAYAVLNSSPSLSLCTDVPVDMLYTTRDNRRRAAVVHPHVWSRELPTSSLVKVHDALAVTSPAFTLLLIAATLSLPRLVMAVSELAGSFAVYEPPEPIRRLLEEMQARGELPDFGSWRPAFDREGRLSDVWSRPALVTCDRLGALVESGSCRGVRGRGRLAEAVRLAVAGAASPFEVQTGMLLGWDEARGGEGYGGFSHNRRVALSDPARRLARRSCCYCDLYWERQEGRDALDLECKSALHHNNETSYLSDADRAAALQLMDTEVVEATYGQLADERRFDALSHLVARKLAVSPPVRTAEFLAARRRLRKDVFIDWRALLAASPRA